MNKNKYAALLLAALMAAPQVAFAENDPSPKEIRPAEKIQKLQEEGLIVGDETGDLALAKPITRAQFAKVVACALGVKAEAEALNQSPSPFKDVPEDHWAQGYIRALTVHEAARPVPLLRGYEDGSFRPDRSVTGAEASKVATLLVDDSLTAEEAALFSWPDSWIYRAMAFSLPVADEPANVPATREAVFLTLYDILYAKPAYNVDMSRFFYLANGLNRRSTFDHGAFQRAFLNRLNAERRRYHIRPLTLSKSMEAGAYTRAKELALYGNMRVNGKRHVRPNGDGYYTAYGYLNKRNPAFFVGENLIQFPLKKKGYSNSQSLAIDPEALAEECFKAWSLSPGHRDNMLSPIYKNMNIQVYAGPVLRYEDSSDEGVLIGALGLSR